MDEIRDVRDKRPLFVKLSPDLNDVELSDLLQVSEDFGVGGYVISNTSSKRDGLYYTPREEIGKIGAGGLSGRPIKHLSNGMIKKVYSETKKPIIGVGGVFNVYDTLEKISAGACLVQVLTGLAYKGPGIVKDINKNLVRFLYDSSISERVGDSNR